MSEQRRAFARRLIRSADDVLGFVAVSRGLVSEQQLEDCLTMQEAGGGRPRLAEILVEQAGLTREMVAQLLAELQAAPTPADAVPRDAARRIGKFTLVQELGSGAAASVWRAWDEELRRWVAIKILNLQGAAHQQRFLREARMAARLSHPGIVSVYEIGEDDARPYIVMQCIDGRSLAGARLGTRELLDVMVRVAEAVHFAHGQGVVHRDIKPANLLRDRSGQVYVADFGLAREVHQETALTAHGVVVGTPAYMSPEQASGEAVDALSDVYSLGATFYDLLLGRPPHAGATMAQMLRRILQDEPPAPRALRADVHSDIEAILLKALEKSRSRRYATAGYLAADLRRFLNGEPVQAVRLTAWRRMWRGSRRRAVPALVAACALAAMTAAFSSCLATRQADVARRSADELARREELWRAMPPIQRRIERIRGHYRRTEFNREALESDFAKALSDLGDLRKRFKGVPEVECLIGTVHGLRGDSALAEQAYRAALAARPDFGPARLGLTQLLLTRSVANSMDGGEVRQAAEDRAEAQRLLDGATLTPWTDAGDVDEMERLFRGLGHFMTGDAAEATRVLDEGWRRGYERCGEWLAFVEMRRSRYESAQGVLDDALASRPWAPNLLLLRAHLQMMRGNAKAARTDLERAIRSAPAGVIIHDLAGRLAVEEQLFGEAEEHYTRAIEMQERSFRLVLRGEVRLASGKRDDALADYDRAIALAPQAPAAYAARAALRQREGDREGAVADYELALAVDENFTPALIGLAQLTARWISCEEALRLYDRAVATKTREKTMAEALLGRASVLAELGRFEEAIDDAERARNVPACRARAARLLELIHERK